MQDSLNTTIPAQDMFPRTRSLVYIREWLLYTKAPTDVRARHLSNKELCRMSEEHKVQHRIMGRGIQVHNTVQIAVDVTDIQGYPPVFTVSSTALITVCNLSNKAMCHVFESQET